MPSQIDQQVKKNLGLAFNANTATINATDIAVNAINDGINAIDDVVNELAEEDIDENIVNVEDYVKDHKRLQLFSKNFNAPEQGFSNAKINSNIQHSLNELLQSTYQKNKVVNSLIAAKQHDQQKLPIKLTKRGIKLSMENLTISENKPKRLYMKGKIYVPKSKKLQLFLLQQYHNPASQSYLGYKAMFQKLQENWF